MHKFLNLARGVITIAPTTTLGTTATVGPGDVWPEDGPFTVVTWPAGEDAPTHTNAEYLLIGKNASGKWTSITRGDQGSTARKINVGDNVALAWDLSDIEDMQQAIASVILDPQDADCNADLHAAMASLEGIGGTILLLSDGTFSSTLQLLDGVEIVGRGVPSRWFSEVDPVKLTYTGFGPAMKAANVGETIRASIALRRLRLDGGSLTGGTKHGLVVDGTAGGAGAGVVGVLLDEISITNFPGHQLATEGLAFDIRAIRSSLHNKDKVADHLVYCNSSGAGGKLTGQVTFDDCFLIPYTAGKWAVFGSSGGQFDLRMFGGTVAPSAGGEGAHGVRWPGPLDIYGTHLEGVNPEQSNVGIRALGANGGNIFPGYCAAFGTGVQIGDPGEAATAAEDFLIAGMVGGNTTDIHITHGGIRAGTKILRTGRASGEPAVVKDDRLGTDGEDEVQRLDADVGKYTGLEVREPNETYLCSATKRTKVLVTLKLKGGGFFTSAALKINGVTLQAIQVITAGEELDHDLPLSFDVPAGKTWEIEDGTGGVVAMSSSYLRER